jgi:formylglycine-generating enzyme
MVTRLGHPPARRASGLLWLCALFLSACNAILGIDDHLLADGGTLADGAVEAGPTPDAGRDSSGPSLDGSPDVVKDAANDIETYTTLPTPLASCRPGGLGMSNCGVGGNADCCDSLPVVGGSFDRRYSDGDGGTGETFADAGPSPATVSDFRLDVYEVTVGRFRRFVEAWRGGFRPPAGSGTHVHSNGGKGLELAGASGTFETGWALGDDANVDVSDKHFTIEGVKLATWTPTPDGHENLPMNFVTRLDAYAFCIWDGGFLPSEAEWEFAAAGGSEQLVYPWGSAAPGTSNEYANYDCNFPSPSMSCAGSAHIQPVGSDPMGKARWGQLDLAGNLFEWALDFEGAYTVPCTDCADFTPNDVGIARGGAYFFLGATIYPEYRGTFDTADGVDFIGLRCARPP